LPPELHEVSAMTTLQTHETETLELAAAAAHSLNNVIAVLYAASGYLESAANPRSLERAARALGDACGSALCLSAALSLLALPPAGRLHVPAGGQEIHPEDLARVLETLEAATNAKSLGQEAVGEPVRATIDRDTLQSLLVCAGSLLRRAVGREAPLRCDVRLTAGGSGTPGRLEFELCCAGPAPADSQRDPCELALAHAMAHLPILATQMDRSRPGSIRFCVELAGSA
jgi:hypothetical protein